MNNKKTINCQLVFASLLLVLGIVGFFWVLLPPTKNSVFLDLQEIRVPIKDETYAMLQDPYQMEITAPKLAKFGQQFGFSFKLSQSSQPLNVTSQDVDIFDYYQINLQLRPDLENTTINPPGSMTTALLPGQEPAMVWKMDAASKEEISGTFWVYMEFVPLQDGLEKTSTALLARNISIPVKTVFGLNTRWITILATAVIVAAIFLGIPQLPFFKGEGAHERKK